jgi:putative copper export protein
VILYPLSVFLHLLSAIIWIGGMLFLALVVVPVTRSLPPAERATLFGAMGRRFRTVGWACIAALLVTGTVNSAYRGVTWDTLFMPALWSSPFGTTLALKLAVVMVMLGLSVYHDFVIGPRSVRALEQAAAHGLSGATSSPGAPARSATRPAVRPGLMQEDRRLRRHASVVGRLEAILALVVLALAIMLVRGGAAALSLRDQRGERR